LYFSLSPEIEIKKKRWFNSPFDKRNKQLSKTLNSKALKALENSDLPIFHFNEYNQIGNSFGEKLGNAFQKLYDLGFEAVISVGNDCPDLDQIDWNWIQTELISGQSVLGPNLRGGTYLIGLSKNNFDRDQFAKLPWQKPALFHSIKEYCGLDNVNILRQLRDLNTLQDLFKYLEHSNARGFKKLLTLLFTLPVFTPALSFQYLETSYTPISFRGPPSAEF
jgi:uncharacterized protein